MLELSFEKEVVKTLTTGSNQWVERKDLYGATPNQLWANFRDKLITITMLNCRDTL